MATNLGATLAAARLAGQRLGTQPRGGHFVCVVGAGARGDATPGYAAYGATKAALAQLTKSLAAEAADARTRHPDSPAARVGWHTLSPGLVLSPLLLTGTVGSTSPDGPVRARVRAAAFNALAAHPEVSAAHAVPRLRSAVAARAAGVKVTYLTPPACRRQADRVAVHAEASGPRHGGPSLGARARAPGRARDAARGGARGQAVEGVGAVVRDEHGHAVAGDCGAVVRVCGGMKEEKVFSRFRFLYHHPRTCLVPPRTHCSLYH